MGHRCDEFVGQNGVTGRDGGHRLLHGEARGRRLPKRKGCGGRAGSRDGLSGRVRTDVPQGREAPRAAKRQRQGLHVQAISAAMQAYGLCQEFIRPYTPQNNGMIERFFRSLKEECIWLHNFEGLLDARDAILKWVAFYNELRPHQALGYLSPLEVEAQQLQRVA
ncbi:MAG: integrase core domain-containing protein [Bacteroidota bacterium]